MSDAMEDQLQPREVSSNVSGGVNASADGGQVNVGGDITGRDKTISAQTYIEHVEITYRPEDTGQFASSRSVNYLDFEVEIGQGRGREYPLSVMKSPAGEARETLLFPFDELALENRLQNLQIALLRSGGVRRQALSPEEHTVQDFGRELFNALFTGEARSRYDVSCGVARQQGKGLRLKLRILPPELAKLPWEFLYDPRQAEYVCLSRDTPIVRYLELSQPIQPLLVKPPLRILGMIASPSDLPPLDVVREKQRVEKAIAGLQTGGLIELTWLNGQTWRDLQRAMRGGPWHIFHFIGHGGFDSEADEGLIALSDDNGNAHRFLATELGRLLADHRSLRLVLLNSCEGARGSEHDVFSSTAAILVRRGVPAVVAMQYEITDRAAVEFARSFYEALVEGLPVDAAVAEARKAVSLDVTNTVEWGTPVLYSRAPQGVIFQLPEALRAKQPVLPSASGTDRELEQKLERWFTEGLAAFWVEDWDKANRSFQSIIDVRPNYPQAAAKLEESQCQCRWSALYVQAQKAQEARNWPEAVAALEKLTAEAGDFKGAVALLKSVKQQKQLADLYAEARRLSQAKQWQAVVNVFAQIAVLKPDYADPDGLLSAAQKEVTALKRQAELSDLYSRAVRAMDVRRWPEAQRLLAQVQGAEPGFREADRLLARAEAEIAREQEEHQRQEQIATLYEQASGLARAQQWRPALAKVQEIKKIDPEFADPEGIAAKAQTEIARADQEAQRQNELATRYAEAVRLLKAERYQEALEKWRAIRSSEPRYPDRNNLQETAGRKLAELQKPTSAKRKQPWWIIVAVGGLLVLVTLAVGTLLNSGSSKTPEPTATFLPVAVTLPTSTSLPVTAEAPAAAPVQTITGSPIASTPATMTLRIRVTSSSDWSTVTLMDTALVLDHADGETSGGPFRASMTGNAIELNQEIEKAFAENVVSTVKDVVLAKQSENASLKFGVGMGCVGITTVEVFNIVTDSPTLVGRDMIESCILPYGSTFTVETKNLLSKEPTPAATPHPGEELYRLGMLALQRKAFEESYTYFDQAVAAGWGTAKLYFNRAYACDQWYWAEGACTLEQAVNDYSRAIELDPDAEYFRRRGLLYLAMKNYQAAYNDLTKAIEIKPSESLAYIDRGRVYFDMGDFANALLDFDKALEIDPQNHWSYIWRGKVYCTKSQDNANALNNFNKAVEMASKDPNPYYHRGSCYETLQQWDKQIADFTEVIRLSPGWTDAYWHRGYGYQQLGQIANARADYLKFLDLAEGISSFDDLRRNAQTWLAQHPQ